MRIQKSFQLDAAQYINSGVLVINVRQWIQESTSKECFDFLSRIASTKYVFMDQDILNAVCRNRIYYLDESWNYSWLWRFGDRETVENCKATVDRIGENFRVLHFTTDKKPWNTLEHPYSHFFWEYAAQTPFLEEIIKTNLCSRKELEKDAASLRIGRAITWAPRKVRGGVRCFQENGAGYTLRRALYHVGLWEDEEAPKSPENRPKLLLRAERILHSAKGNR